MINAHKEKLASFFHGNIQYFIPFFQRPYVWNEENWETLWENVTQIFERYKNKESAEHFIGTLIIKQKISEKLGETNFDLVDGQQRLTTISILLKALADVSDGTLPKLKAQTIELLRLEDARGNTFNRIEHSEVDKEYFDAIISGSDKEKLGNKNHKMLRAYKFFKSKLKGKPDEELNEIKVIILDKVPIISMMLSVDDDEQVIFDTINSLGVKLTTAELLKNFLFKEKELKFFYHSVWQPTFEYDEEQIDFWNKEKTSGRIIRTNVEVLLYCYLIIETQQEVRLERLFKEYKDWLTGKSIEEKKDFISRLKNYADTYFALPGGEELNEIAFTESEKRFFHIIENLEITTAYPLVLYIYNEYSDAEERKAFLLVLESFIVRRNICRLTTQNYNKVFIAIIQKMKSQQVETKVNLSIAEFKSIFTEMKEEVNRSPSDTDVEHAFANIHLNNNYAREILYCLSLYLKDNDLSDVKKLSSNSFSLEHILPKKWEDNWPIKDASEENSEIRDRALYTLGNLTLITKKLNSKLQNSSWEVKKQHLTKYSSIQITTNYLGLSDWNEKEIEKRGVHLGKIALKIWPA